MYPLIRAAICCLCAAIFFTTLHAQDDTPTLDPVVISATRLPSKVENAPSIVREISGQALGQRQVRNLPEALRELPGVHVQKTSNGQGSPYIRGFTGFRSLALIDGVRFNNSTFRDGPNQYWGTIDAYAVDRIELLPNQGSVLYGSDAIGGTLNVLTQDSGFADVEKGKAFSRVSGSYRWSSAESSHAERLTADIGQGQQWGLHLGGTLRQFGDLHAAGLGRQRKTAYDEWAYDTRLDVSFGNDWILTAVHQQLREDDVWRTHSTIYAEPWHGTSIGSDLRRSFDQERTLSYLRLAGSHLDGIVESTSLTLSWQTVEETQTRIRSNRARDLSVVDLDSFGLDFQLASETPLGKFTYGLDYYRDEVDSGGLSYKPDGSFDKRAIQGPVGDDSSYDLFGIFAQDEIALGKRGHLFLGARYTRAQADVGRYEDPLTKAASSFSDDWDHFVSSARLVIDLDTEDHFKLFGGVSQGFRAPNLSDLSRLDIARSGELEVAATDLKPEEFLNFELGLKARKDNFSGSLTYFHTRIDDLIVRRPTGRSVGTNIEVSKANAGEGYVHGLELAAEFSLNDHWTIFGDISWTEGEADQYPGRDGKAEREPLSRVVPWIGHGGLRWHDEDRGLWAELACTAVSRADRLNSGDIADNQRIPPSGTPGYTYLVLRGGWAITPNLSLTASLENLLDEEYRSHGSGTNEPGFGGVLSLTCRM